MPSNAHIDLYWLPARVPGATKDMGAPQDLLIIVGKGTPLDGCVILVELADGAGRRSCAFVGVLPEAGRPLVVPVHDIRAPFTVETVFFPSEAERPFHSIGPTFRDPQSGAASSARLLTTCLIEFQSARQRVWPAVLLEAPWERSLGDKPDAVRAVAALERASATSFEASHAGVWLTPELGNSERGPSEFFPQRKRKVHIEAAFERPPQRARRPRAGLAQRLTSSDARDSSLAHYAREHAPEPEMLVLEIGVEHVPGEGSRPPRIERHPREASLGVQSLPFRKGDADALRIGRHRQTEVKPVSDAGVLRSYQHDPAGRTYYVYVFELPRPALNEVLLLGGLAGAADFRFRQHGSIDEPISLDSDRPALIHREPRRIRGLVRKAPRGSRPDQIVAYADPAEDAVPLPEGAAGRKSTIATERDLFAQILERHPLRAEPSDPAHELVALAGQRNLLPAPFEFDAFASLVGANGPILGAFVLYRAISLAAAGERISAATRAALFATIGPQLLSPDRLFSPLIDVALQLDPARLPDPDLRDAVDLRLAVLLLARSGPASSWLTEVAPADLSALAVICVSGKGRILRQLIASKLLPQLDDVQSPDLAELAAVFPEELDLEAERGLILPALRRCIELQHGILPLADWLDAEQAAGLIDRIYKKPGIEPLPLAALRAWWLQMRAPYGQMRDQLSALRSALDRHELLGDMLIPRPLASATENGLAASVAGLRRRAEGAAAPLGSVLLSYLAENEQPLPPVRAVVARMLHLAELSRRCIDILAARLQKSGWREESIAEIADAIGDTLVHPRAGAERLLGNWRAFDRLAANTHGQNSLQQEIRAAIAARATPLQAWLTKVSRMEENRYGIRMREWFSQLAAGDAAQRFVSCIEIVSFGLATYDYDAALRDDLAGAFAACERLYANAQARGSAVPTGWHELATQVEIQVRELKRNLQAPLDQAAGGLVERVRRARSLVAAVGQLSGADSEPA